MAFSSRLFRTCAFAMLGLIAAGNVAAQTTDASRHPARPIRLILPFPPGGSGDIIARIMAQRLGERLGQPLVIDNRSGASGLIGLELAVRAAPDGYTMVLVSTSHTQLPAIQKVPYDLVKQLAPVAHLATGPSSICTYPGFPAQNVKDLVALARAKPGQLRYGSSGTGGINHFAGEFFNQLAKINLTHIPFKGGAPLIIDVIAGRVEVAFGSVVAFLPHVRSGKMKALGLTKRSPLLPEVAAINETVPGYDAHIWWGVAVPTGVPAPVIAKLNGEINAVLREPEMAKRLGGESAEPVTAPPAVFGKLLASEILKWARVAKETGIRAE